MALLCIVCGEPKHTGPCEKDARTPTTIYRDKDFVRTAIVIAGEGENQTGSLDVVDETGKRLCQINISLVRGHKEDGGECFMVDVIDVDERYEDRGVIAFSQKKRAHMQMPGNIASVDFRRPRKR